MSKENASEEGLETTSLPIKKPSISLVNEQESARNESGKENRLHTRLPLVIRAEIQREGAQSHVGYLTNLSLGGAFLAMEKSPPIDTPMHLHIFLPWKLGNLEAEARVVWSSANGTPTDPPGVGLKFTGLDSHAEGRLRAYVDAFFRLVAQIEE